MRLSLRSRIVLTLVPLLALLALLGGAAVVLLQRLGGRIDLILRENYDSVIAMERLNEALERIDSSFQFALAGQEKAREQYEQNWKSYREAQWLEENNITLPGEQELVDRLTDLSRRYHRQGDAFYAHGSQGGQRQQDYFGSGGLLDSFKGVKNVSGQILRLNQDNMEEASRDARQTARDSLVGFGIGMVVTVLAAAWLAWHTIRGILRPIQAVTQSALAIGLGNLDQVVPVQTRDELGQLAEAFNTMARQLREIRRSSYSRLLSAQRTSQATIDSFPDPVLVVDTEGHVEMANPSARRILGVIVVHEHERPALPWQPPASIARHLAEALKHQRPYLPQEFDQVLVLPVEAEEHAFLPHVMPIGDPYGNALGAAVLLQDVTRFRLLDQVKSDLVATVSHELKTPLTGVRLVLHLLLEENVGPLTPKQTELLLDARENAERLLARVNSLLDLTRLERGRSQLDLRAESPAELLQAAADVVRPRALDKRLAIQVEAAPDLPLVAADAQRLGFALNNLLDNAVTYTDRGGKISLSATAAGDTVTLAVADTGVGISPEYLPHIFERFFRVPGQSRGSGTGLGLALVREIITAHGGAVTCESRPGEGTIFRLTLPVWRESPAAHMPGPATAGIHQPLVS
jgi:signal transduction histidine kinase